MSYSLYANRYHNTSSSSMYTGSSSASSIGSLGGGAVGGVGSSNHDGMTATGLYASALPYTSPHGGSSSSLHHMAVPYTGSHSGHSVGSCSSVSSYHSGGGGLLGHTGTGSGYNSRSSSIGSLTSLGDTTRYGSSRYSDPAGSSIYDSSRYSSSSRSSERPGSGSTTSSYSRYTPGSLSSDKDIDYKKLYEQERLENERLRRDVTKIQQDLADTRQDLERSRQKSNYDASTDKRERRALERKISKKKKVPTATLR